MNCHFHGLFAKVQTADFVEQKLHNFNYQQNTIENKAPRKHKLIV
jgi:hypothetical protein